MAITAQNVVNIAPDFVSLTTSAFGGTGATDVIGTVFIPIAQTQHNPSFYGGPNARSDAALALLTAHLIACAYPSLYNDEAEVTSEKVGEVAASFAVAVPVAGDLVTSRFGQEYRRMARAMGGTVQVL